MFRALRSAPRVVGLRQVSDICAELKATLKKKNEELAPKINELLGTDA